MGRQPGGARNCLPQSGKRIGNEVESWAVGIKCHSLVGFSAFPMNNTPSITAGVKSSSCSISSRVFLMNACILNHIFYSWYQRFASNNHRTTSWTYPQSEMDDRISRNFWFSAGSGYFCLRLGISRFIEYTLPTVKNCVMRLHHWKPISIFPLRKKVSKRVRIPATPKRNRTQGM